MSFLVGSTSTKLHARKLRGNNFYKDSGSVTRPGTTPRLRTPAGTLTRPLRSPRQDLLTTLKPPPRRPPRTPVRGRERMIRVSAAPLAILPEPGARLGQILRHALGLDLKQLRHVSDQHHWSLLASHRAPLTV